MNMFTTFSCSSSAFLRASGDVSADLKVLVLFTIESNEPLAHYLSILVFEKELMLC